ncbi:hypothetical protein A5819_001757 [Enterococcus sp. 7E2_DIV0204]|uniref:Gram-positive cocci surface proteins LPxTG domain-containing protein n=1 Tax=Candidatus Enterococcus lemimoniae TaxID=1834167 RepID=A0ABZ2T5H3_9ENTE|nr:MULTISPECIES: hypothetical protein [unclassified Enterococcus]OTN89265.1 hypothetical protein A5819_001757 [Enterococcus sp. 7E2_DIV0204]OTO68113.1 hypothetical protein A5866_000308 [Enterococcus sp. 12C11_DIV0727]OTP51711.1 hypothetical protein A5884_000906 [Enterococcus sp. 7D2_DIV0200]
MKKQYVIWPLLIVMCVFGSLLSQSSQVFAEQEKTDTGISFNQFIEPEKPKPPIYETKPTGYPDTDGALPHLGQMMTSFILLLLGVACLIVFLGVISLRKVYSIHV